MSLLVQPRDGIPTIATGAASIARAASRLAAGHGSIAIDTERASSFRYDDRAFVIQAKRADAGIVLFDVESHPGAIRKNLGPVVNGHHWILHAAASDLPCLADLGLYPNSLFDTEIAGRLLGFPRVNLSAMTEEFLGLSLKKQHSANNWSFRPLPKSWLNYAALDVELLLELAEAMAQQLHTENKLDWLEQECAYILECHHQPRQATKTWLDLKGLSRLKTRQQLAVAKFLWIARDDIGRETDTACSALLPDKTLIAIATELPTSKRKLLALPEYPFWLRKHAHEWLSIVRSIVAGGSSTWPSMQEVRAHRKDLAVSNRNQLHDYPAVRSTLSAAREVLGSIAAENQVQVDTLFQPLALRKTVWEVIQTTNIHTPTQLYHQLKAVGVRPWQIQLTFDSLAALLLDVA